MGSMHLTDNMRHLLKFNFSSRRSVHEKGWKGPFEVSSLSDSCWM